MLPDTVIRLAQVLHSNSCYLDRFLDYNTFLHLNIPCMLICHTTHSSPYMLAQNVKIYNPTSVSEKPIAEIKKMVVDLSLVSLLKGAIDIRHMSFEEPIINVEFLIDDKLNWKMSRLSPDWRLQPRKCMQIWRQIESICTDCVIILLQKWRKWMEYP